MTVAQQLPQVKVLPFGMHNGQAASVPLFLLFSGSSMSVKKERRRKGLLFSAIIMGAS